MKFNGIPLTTGFGGISTFLRFLIPPLTAINNSSTKSVVYPVLVLTMSISTFGPSSLSIISAVIPEAWEVSIISNLMGGFEKLMGGGLPFGGGGGIPPLGIGGGTPWEVSSGFMMKEPFFIPVSSTGFSSGVSSGTSPGTSSSSG